MGDHVPLLHALGTGNPVRNWTSHWAWTPLEDWGPLETGSPLEKRGLRWKLETPTRNWITRQKLDPMSESGH